MHPALIFFIGMLLFGGEVLAVMYWEHRRK